MSKGYKMWEMLYKNLTDSQEISLNLLIMSSEIMYLEGVGLFFIGVDIYLSASMLIV